MTCRHCTGENAHFPTRLGTEQLGSSGSCSVAARVLLAQLANVRASMRILLRAGAGREDNAVNSKEVGTEAATAFAATDWSLILSAAQTGSPRAQGALEALCAAYWFPLYAYLRRKGHSTQDAEDLLQQFYLTRVLNKRILAGVRPDAGRFRSWLLTCLRNMVANELARPEFRARARTTALLLDAEVVEARYALAQLDEHSADVSYDRSWANTLIERATTALREEYGAAGRGAWFDELAGYLPGPASTRPYAELAERLGVEENHVRAEVNKLRRRCGERLYAEIRRTVQTAKEAKQELEYLLGLLE
jgi:RNA polymerase sigma factor (sigma-70 family)